MKILAVHDSPYLLMTLQTILEREGYEFDIALGGVMGLEYLCDEPWPDLILIDYSMRDMTGLEFMLGVRRQFPNFKVPVMMFTGLAPTEMESIGIVRAIQKPVDPAVLVALVKKYCYVKQMNVRVQ